MESRFQGKIKQVIFQVKDLHTEAKAKFLSIAVIISKKKNIHRNINKPY